MSGNIQYSVEVQWLQRGSLDSGLNKAAGSADKVKNALRDAHSYASKFGAASGAFKSFNSAFDSIASSAAGMAGGAFAVGTGAIATGFVAAAKVAFEFNKELEETKIALSAIMSANDEKLSFGNSMRLAGDLMGKMREDARVLPGEFKDIAGIMQMITGPLADMGIGAWNAEGLAKNLMVNSAIDKISPQVVAREAAMILEGNARSSQPLFRKLNMGMSAKQFNALDAKERYRLFDAKAAKFSSPEARQAFEGTWETIISTIKGSTRQTYGMLFGDVFEHAKDRLRSVFHMDQDPLAASKWKERLTDVGIDLSKRLVDGFEGAFSFAESSIQKWGPHVQTFLGTAERGFHRLFSGFDRLAGGASSHLMKFLDDPRAFHKLESLVGKLVGLRAAGALGSTGASMAGMMMPALANAGVGGAALAAAAGGAAVAVGALALAGYGASRVLFDSSNQLHGAAISMTHQIASDSSKLGSSLNSLWASAQPLTDLLGTGLVGAATLAVKGLSDLARALNFVTGGKDAETGLQLPDNPFATGGKTLGTWLRQKFFPGMKDTPLEGFDRPFTTMPRKVFDADALAEQERAPKVINHTTNVGKVEIHVAQNGDPNRVAKATLKAFQDLRRFPISSSGNPNPTGRF